ncbi:MAG TPA: CopG family transcriptional regulator [Alphaproteobacteria bacterium]|nr:CopG family transcriptional regulator [Alphaproteobacteria bacterium]
MSGRNFSVRTESEKLVEIDAIAEAHDRSRNFVVNEAIDRYLAEERQWVAKVNEGLAAAEAGDFAAKDEVEVLFKGFEDAAR